MKTKQRVIPVTEFKAKCLRIIDEVAESGDGVLISKRGKIAVKLSPLVERDESSMGLKDSLKGQVTIRGDLAGFSSAGEWKDNE